jgi:rubrerythrin
MINQLIREMNFNPVDPFDIKKDIFPVKFKKIPNYNSFLEDFYRSWLMFTFFGEFDTTIGYPELLKGIKNGKYNQYLSDFSSDEHAQLCNYFSEMIREENEHTEYLLNFVKTIYGDSVTEELSDEVLDLARTTALDQVENTDLVKMLVRYYAGECYLWTCFYQIYKQTHDPDKRKVFKKVLVEEAQHNNKIYKLVKRIKHNVTIDLMPWFIEFCQRYRYFGFIFVKDHFKLNDENTRKDHAIIELVYDTEWHAEFNQLLIKKCYQMFGILYPNISIEEFTNLVNQNNGAWSKN